MSAYTESSSVWDDDDSLLSHLSSRARKVPHTRPLDNPRIMSPSMDSNWGTVSFAKSLADLNSLHRNTVTPSIFNRSFKDQSYRSNTLTPRHEPATISGTPSELKNGPQDIVGDDNVGDDSVGADHQTIDTQPELSSTIRSHSHNRSRVSILGSPQEPTSSTRKLNRFASIKTQPSFASLNEVVANSDFENLAHLLRKSSQGQEILNQYLASKKIEIPREYKTDEESDGDMDVNIRRGDVERDEAQKRETYRESVESDAQRDAQRGSIRSDVSHGDIPLKLKVQSELQPEEEEQLADRKPTNDNLNEEMKHKNRFTRYNHGDESFEDMYQTPVGVNGHEVELKSNNEHGHEHGHEHSHKYGSEDSHRTEHGHKHNHQSNHHIQHYQHSPAFHQYEHESKQIQTSFQEKQDFAAQQAEEKIKSLEKQLKQLQLELSRRDNEDNQNIQDSPDATLKLNDQFFTENRNNARVLDGGWKSDKSNQTATEGHINATKDRTTAAQDRTIVTQTTAKDRSTATQKRTTATQPRSSTSQRQNTTSQNQSKSASVSFAEFENENLIYSDNIYRKLEMNEIDKLDLKTAQNHLKKITEAFKTIPFSELMKKMPAIGHYMNQDDSCYIFSDQIHHILYQGRRLKRAKDGLVNENCLQEMAHRVAVMADAYNALCQALEEVV